MSDYEDEGWNPIDLSIRPGPVNSQSTILTESIGPLNDSFAEYQAHDPNFTARKKKSLQPRVAKSFHPSLQDIQPRAHHGTGGKPVQRSFDIPQSYQDSAAYQQHLENPNDPDDVYELDIAWKNLLRAIPENMDGRARDIARMQLDTIGVFSEAFLRTPDPDSMKVEIWGDKQQCFKAKTRLQAWEGHLRSTGKRPSQKTWTKQQAYDGRKEDRKRQELWQELQDQNLQGADDSQFPLEAYLVWPQDFDLDAYIKKYEVGTLKEISKEFRCRFKHEKKVRPRYTKVQAGKEVNLLAAYQRLINLVKEMVAQKNRGTHGNFCRLPSPEAYRDEVIVQRISDVPTAPYFTTLLGREMDENEISQWLDWRKFYERQNRTEIQSSMDSFFKALYVSQCHVRLRVSFGDLLLQQFSTGKDGGLKFTFDDFLVMLQGRRTELSEPVLRGTQSNLALLADKLMAMEQFQLPVEAYRQVFEFKGTDNSNRLRLEIEMQPGYDSDEPQVCGQRWLTFKTYGRTENVLGLKVFDFEKPGYMIRADSYDLFTNDSVIREMEAFRCAVSFKPSRDGFKAYPKLRSSFAGHDKLTAVTEYTSIIFRFQNTDGVVELRQEDVFLQDKKPPSKLPDHTRFEVLYYYSEWDNLLGEFSDIQPGEAVSWQQDLTTFFPTHIDEDHPRSLPKGFKPFIKEVEEIQELLREALSSLVDDEASVRS